MHIISPDENLEDHITFQALDCLGFKLLLCIRDWSVQDSIFQH